MALIPPKVDLGARLPAAADGSLPKWPPCQPRSLLIPRVRALTELLRLYVCGLQPRPSVQLSSSRVIANDNEYSRENGNPEFFEPGLPTSARVTSHMYIACIQCRFARSQSFNSLRTARQGAPSDPASFTGGQINSYRPAGTSERSTPSSKTTPRSRNARWTGTCSSARATER